MKTIRDHHKRRSFFIQESFRHPAKANLYMLDQLLSQYFEPGIMTVDPFGGIGGSLLALDHEMPTVVGEYEAYWANIAGKNLAKLQGQRILAQVTPGLVCQWDARHLPLRSESVGQVITSPPYGDVFSNWHAKSSAKKDQYHPDWGPAYSLDPANLGNIHIYEDFLREMRRCLAEIYRILSMSGKMVAILKNYVRKGQVIDLVEDFALLCRSCGFNLIARTEREVIPSYYAHLNRLQNPNHPDIGDEMVLVFEKVPLWKPETRLLIVMPVAPDQPLLKMIDEATRKHWRTRIFLHKNGLAHCFCPEKSGVSPDAPFRVRKTWALNTVSQLVGGKLAWQGCAYELHGSEKLTQYLKMRLQTLGCSVTEPALGLNYGQKLAFYKEKLC